MKTQLLAWSIALCGASLAQAQPMSPYYPQPGMPMFVQPSPYPAPYAPLPAAPRGNAPYVYYGDFPNANPVPTPRPMSVPAQVIPPATSRPMGTTTQWTGPTPGSSGPVYIYQEAQPAPAPAPYNYYPLGQPGRSLPPVPAPRFASGWPIPAPDSNPDAPPPAMPWDKPFHRKTTDIFWFTGDYVATLIRPMRTAGILVTTGSATDPAQGAIGQPGTRALYPVNNAIDFGLASGFRVEGGFFLDSCDRFSLDARLTYMAPITQSFGAASDSAGNPVLARPVYNVVANREGAFLNSLANTIAGSINVDTRSQLWGIELNGRYHVYWWERLHADALFGFRYSRLAETMTISERINPLTPAFLTFQGAAVNQPNALTDIDNFRTANHFFGPQLGLRASWEFPWMSLGTYSKVALGATQQRINIDGSTTLITPAGNQTVPGGILALPSNIGSYNRTVFSLMPEFGVNATFDLTQRFKVQLGYSLLMWTHVVRPGYAFDRNINPNQAPGSPTFGPLAGPAAPGFRFNDELFYTHNFSVGFEFHY